MGDVLDRRGFVAVAPLLARARPPFLEHALDDRLKAEIFTDCVSRSVDNGGCTSDRLLARESMRLRSRKPSGPYGQFTKRQLRDKLM